MRESRRGKVLRAAGPLLQPGERAEIITLAKVGTVPVKKNVASFAVSAAVSVALGGTVFVAFAPSETYMLLTDRQLLFFASNRQTGGPGPHRASIQREAITPTVLKDSLPSSTPIAANGQAHPGGGSRPGSAPDFNVLRAATRRQRHHSQRTARRSASNCNTHSRASKQCTRRANAPPEPDNLSAAIDTSRAAANRS